MVIRFEEDEQWDADRNGVLFWAVADGARVRCFLSREAIDGFFGTSSAEEQGSYRFRAKRWEFLADAAILIESGRLNKVSGQTFTEVVITSRIARSREIIERLSQRWPDLTVVAKNGCTVCDRFGDLYVYDDYSGTGNINPAEDALPRIANLDPSPDTFTDGAYTLHLRECPSCGALFEGRRYPLTAADNLFASDNVELRRISPRQAIALLQENSAIR